MKLLLVAALMAQVQGTGGGTSSSSQQAERRGWFGITVSCEECFVLRGGNDRVAYVRFPALVSVEAGSPAHQAGLRRGDTLVAAEGMPLTTPEGFQRYAEARPNQPIRLTVRSSGQTREVTVTPIDRASAATIRDFYYSRLRIAQRRGFEALRTGFRTPLGTLGLQLDCTGCISTDFGTATVWQFRSPAAVELVDVGGPAHASGLRSGDTILQINGVDLMTSEGGRAFSTIEPGQRLTLTVRRNGAERRVAVTAAPRQDATREELAFFEQYRRARDSTEAARRAAAATVQDIAEIQVAPRLLRMQPDAQVSLTATVYGADGMPRAVPVRWQSNNVHVADVDAQGLVRAIGPGTAIVQAIIEGGGRRRAGQATVVVGRESGMAPGPGRPGGSGLPMAPGQPPIVYVTPHDSMVKASINCTEPAVNAMNPMRACYDRRPVLNGAPQASVPGACAAPEQVTSVTVNVQVSEAGRVLDARPFAPSNCHEFTEAALQAARQFTFTAAQQNGQPVRAWMLVRVRPVR